MTFEEFREEWESGEDFILAHTSGSTGTPKEIRLPKTLMRISAGATNDFFALGKGARFHSCVAADFIGGKMMLVRALMADGIFTAETPSNHPLSTLHPSEEIDLLAVVPSQMIHILENVSSLPNIKNIIIGGSAINPELRKRIADSGLNCYETYGMTETASHIALRKITNGIPLPFYPLPWVKISIDFRGCLNIAIPNSPFCKSSDKKEHSSDESPAETSIVVTNDLATLSPDGGFYITGRIDDVIITGGKKLNPLEVEEALTRVAGIPVVISSIPDEKWGEKAIAIVPSDSDVSIVKAAMPKLILPKWKHPKCILSLSYLSSLSSQTSDSSLSSFSSLPATRSGKLDRRVLKKLLARMISAIDNP